VRILKPNTYHLEWLYSLAVISPTRFVSITREVTKNCNRAIFFQKLSHLAINTAPYNGRSKTIESAFGRFQSQVMHKLWFFTGQNITTKKEESRPNMEFILANKENLPTLDEAIKQYKECRAEWNAAKHFKQVLLRLRCTGAAITRRLRGWICSL